MTLEELIDEAFIGKRLCTGEPVSTGVVQSVTLDTDYESGWAWLDIYFVDGRTTEISQYDGFTLTDVEEQ